MIVAITDLLVTIKQINHIFIITTTVEQLIMELDELCYEYCCIKAIETDYSLLSFNDTELRDVYVLYTTQPNLSQRPLTRLVVVLTTKSKK